MVLQIILPDILLIACIFPRPCGVRKNTTQLVKYPRVLSVKPSNKVYLFIEGNITVFTDEPVALCPNYLQNSVSKIKQENLLLSVYKKLKHLQDFKN